METVRLLYDGKQFDEQYTFDLQNNLTIHDFHSILGLFNQAARMRPPPRTKIVWLFILSVIWIGSSLFFYTLWHFYVESIFLLLLLPAFLVSSLFLLAFRHRSIRKKFEKNILNICSRVNATENIRGIHFRFFKNGEDVSRQVALSGFAATATYELIIEFDDRFNILKSRQFNKRTGSEELGTSHVTYPPAATVHFNHHYQEDDQNEDMFYANDHPPAWSPPSFDEKAVQLA